MLNRSPILPVLATAGALVLLQLTLSAAGKDSYLTQMIMSAYYAIVAMGLCLVMAYAGQVSLGHAAFFAMGGYTSAVLTTRSFAQVIPPGVACELDRWGILWGRPDPFGVQIVTFTPGAAFGVALLLTFLLALVIGYPALRLRGHYLAMATLGFGLIVYRVVLGSSITNAADGINGVPPWDLGFGLVLSGRRPFRVMNYYLAWSLALLTLLFLLNIVRSRAGRALRAIHDSETAANAMGVDTAAFKLRVFVLSAVLAAAAGSLFTHYNGGIGPSEAGAMKSVRYVALVAVGGMANLWGVFLMSSVLNYLSLRGYFGTLDSAVFGGLLILIIALAPEGPFRAVGDWLRTRGLAGRPRVESRPAPAEVHG
jgi:branched-chain amino acid transport system permease protein